MNTIKILLLISAIVCSTYSSFSYGNTLTDRQQISKTMESFYQWDQTGGIEAAQSSLAQSVRYNRLGNENEHISYTPNFEYSGKGENAYIPYIAELDIYGTMAIVKSIHHYGENKSYLKAFVLHKLSQGWRITNVSWGRITPDK